MKTRFKSATVLFSLICLTLSCSSPTGPSESVRILEQLLDVPAISLPLETEQNKSNDGYSLTVNNCSEVLLNRFIGYQLWISPFYTEGVSAEKYENYFQWSRIRNTKGHQVILSVTPGDTLLFRIDIEDSTPNSSFWYEGWIIPYLDKGFITSKSGMDISWEKMLLGHKFSYQHLDSFWNGPRAAVFDSIAGGGYLVMENYSVDFEAHWDDYGHGTWWSKTQGSGEW